jgi:hypothetical protein
MRISPVVVILAAGAAVSTSVLQAEPRSCRVVFPERPRGAPKIAYLFDGSESRRTSLPSNNLAPVIELPGGELTITMTREEVDGPQALPPDAPRLMIPEGVSDFYILLTSDFENPHVPVRMELVDPEASRLKRGETLWFNRTAHRIIARLGDSEISVNPRSESVSKSPVPKSGYYKAEFSYQLNGEGPEARITEQQWWHDTASKHLGFIVDTGDKLPKIFFYRDYRAADQEAGQAAEE